MSLVAVLLLIAACWIVGGLLNVLFPDWVLEHLIRRFVPKRSFEVLRPTPALVRISGYVFAAFGTIVLGVTVAGWSLSWYVDL